jgi:tRNA pseudouridine55 synthase
MMRLAVAAQIKAEQDTAVNGGTEKTAVDGVLLLDKPTGATSNAVLQRVKRLLGARKAGHVGTLDPLASGLLPICLGEATKFSGSMLAADKAYAADVLLGATSTTGDAEGQITAGKPVHVSRADVEAVIGNFRGEILQIPPIYSALKREGKPLYAYARAGESIEIAPRTVTIHAISLSGFALPNIQLVVHCSKGTYIRVLAEDIGRMLGCGGLLAGLRRVGVGNFDLSAAVRFDAFEAMALPERRAHLKPVDTLVARLPGLTLDHAAARLICTGRRAMITVPGGGFFRLYAADGRFLGVGEATGGELVGKRLMDTSNQTADDISPMGANH